ncbi:MAG: SbcC/MukB-like Walker B domain-containing protein, partial [Fusobacteriaceae bacterium]
NLSKLWFQNEAYKLSAELKTDEPCPVCGSKEHPNPVKKPENLATEKEIETAKKKYEKIKYEKTKKQGNIEQLEKQINDLEKDFFDLCSKHEIKTSEELIIELNKNLNHQLEEKEKIVKELPDKNGLKVIENQIVESEIENKKIEMLKNKLENELNLSQLKKETLMKDIEKIKKIFKEESFEIEKFEILKNEKIDQLETLKKDITRIENIIKDIENNGIRMEESSKIVEELKKQCEEEKIKYEKNLLENGFESIEAYSEALEIDIIKIKGQIEEYTEEKNKTETLKAEYSKYKDKEKIEISVFEIEEKELDTELNRVEQELRESLTKLSPIEEVNKSLKKIRTTQEKSEIEYSRAHKLYEISQGKYGNSKNNVSFQKYVLGVYFQEVLDRANIRLFSMSNKQYKMQIDNTKKGNKNSGLELDVYDTHTGKVRSIKTLSGGETFKASMALALGLSDVVQEQNGGIKLDSVFIDEGFGTLDEDSLSSAIDILTSIQNSGRTVGIISHVSELKQIIPAQILVEKDEKGSRVKVIG